jgi:peptide/nickel transport system ATP-binding protein
MNAPAALAVDRLVTVIEGGGPAIRPVDGVSFDLRPGETFAIVGESGSGKSMTALSLMRLLPETGYVESGRAALGGDDLLVLPEARMRDVRGRRIAMIFQEPGTSLNPVLTCGLQIAEVLARHVGITGAAARDRAIALLESVGIPDAGRRVDEFPFQMSGGMKQRVMIALALAAEPDVLVADEPTTALDVTIQAQVLDLLKDLQRRRGTSILLITHDLGVVARMADRVGVMYAGELVEVATRERFFASPQHPYSRKLFGALPGASARGAPLTVIPGQVPPLDRRFVGCRFADRCDEADERCVGDSPRWTNLRDEQRVRCFRREEGQLPLVFDVSPVAAAREAPVVAAPAPLLEVRDLRVHFPIRRGILKRVVGHVRAVDGVDLAVAPGRTLALVGESGCGKTTVGKAILQLVRPTAGSVRFDGEELTTLGGGALRARRSAMQIVFQDPFASLNPRMRVGDILAEGIVAQGRVRSVADREARVRELLDQVGLPAAAAVRYPHEFSGGQRQRIAIARALGVEPRLIVCDEPTSALDVSIQAQVLNLLAELQQRLGVAYVFITHNLAVVEYLAHEVAVMYLGRIVERGPVAAVLERPRHPYTRALLDAVPRLDGADRRTALRGELPSPASPPAGCHFNPRCPIATDVCRERYPAMAGRGGHESACHHADPGGD